MYSEYDMALALPAYHLTMILIQQKLSFNTIFIVIFTIVKETTFGLKGSVMAHAAADPPTRDDLGPYRSPWP